MYRRLKNEQITFFSASIDDFGPGPEEMKITVQSPGYGHWKGSKYQSLLYHFYK